MPEPRGSALLAVLFQLEQSQWWPAERLLERQLEQLRLLVDHARRWVPFYQERLKGNGDTPNGSAFLEEWLQVPLHGVIAESEGRNLYPIFLCGGSGINIPIRRM